MIVNAVFEGGGVRGIALAGAAAGALECGYRFDRVAGTSAGGLVAGLLAAGYEPGGLRSSLCRIDWRSLLDPVPLRRFPIFGTHLALMFHRGLYRGDALEATWAGLLRRRGIVTFGDLPAGKLRVVVTDLNHQRGVLLPDGLPAYGYDPGRFPVARALRMSAAVPFLFRPVTLADRARGERIQFGDGALASNYPIRAVPHDRPVLGFRLVDAADDHPHLAVRGPASLARAVVTSGIRARYGLPPPPDDASITVQVPVRRDLDFDLSQSEARRLFEDGRQAALARLAVPSR